MSDVSMPVQNELLVDNLVVGGGCYWRKDTEPEFRSPALTLELFSSADDGATMRRVVLLGSVEYLQALVAEMQEAVDTAARAYLTI